MSDIEVNGIVKKGEIQTLIDDFNAEFKVKSEKSGKVLTIE